MRRFSIESNGRLERTAIYLNGEALGGVKEVYIHIDEEGTFDAIIVYDDTNGNRVSKKLFSDYLDGIKTVPPLFSAEEAEALQMFTIESDGDIEDTLLEWNDEPLEGVIELFLHIKKDETNRSSGISSILSGKKQPLASSLFRAELTFRNEDDSVDTENIFL